MRIWFYTLFAVMFLGLSTQEKTISNALDVMEHYLSLDYKGTRLSGKTCGEAFQFVGWYEEPGWDEISLIMDYKIIKKDITENNAIFTVQYKVAGRWLGERTIFEERTEEINFVLQKRQGVWLIMDPRIEPHVSVCSMVNHLKGLAAENKKNGNESDAFSLEIKKLIAKCKEIQT